MQTNTRKQCPYGNAAKIVLTSIKFSPTSKQCELKNIFNGFRRQAGPAKMQIRLHTYYVCHSQSFSLWLESHLHRRLGGVTHFAQRFQYRDWILLGPLLEAIFIKMSRMAIQISNWSLFSVASLAFLYFSISHFLSISPLYLRKLFSIHSKILPANG